VRPGTLPAPLRPGSVGLDLNPKASHEAGLDARRWDFTEGIPSDIGEFDAIWCSNLLERVLAPHAFLIDLRGVLRMNGLLLVVVPQTTRFKWVLGAAGRPRTT
jgi:2-polyprenyl-3-methyl-5-hydroxy-6-metoxy-1,4-benzoquinol methylase